MPVHDWSKATAGDYHDFHNEWISTTRRALLDGVLPADYYAKIDQRVMGFAPDVLTLQERSGLPRPGLAGPAGLKLPKKQPSISSGSPPRFRKNRRIAVYHASGDRLVAIIEIVSSSNKNSETGIESFVTKSVEFLDAGVQLLVVDVLPRGNFDPRGMHAAIWAELTEEVLPRPAKPLAIVSYAVGAEVKAYVEELAPGDTIPDTPLFLNEFGCVEIPAESAYLSAFAVQPPHVQNLLESPPS